VQIKVRGPKYHNKKGGINRGLSIHVFGDVVAAHQYQVEGAVPELYELPAVFLRCVSVEMTFYRCFSLEGVYLFFQHFTA
jgi:hypothetical protein